MESKLCELFEVEFPIMQGGLQWLATPELASAVSNAGGLGTVNSSLYQSKNELTEAIRLMREKTTKPFAVNISMLPNQPAGELAWDFIKVVAQERVPVVELAGRDPTEFVPFLKQAHVKIVHKSPAVRFAKKAETAGVDAVSIVGFECGGHPGMDDVTTMVLIPSVVDAVQIPVLAGGGICDSRSYAAARCLGAEGVVIGTRFMLSQECILHRNFKEAGVRANECATAIVQRSIRNASRVLKNAACMELMNLEEANQPTLQEVLTIVNGQRQKKAYDSGDIQAGMIPMGQCVGRIHTIQSVREIIEEIVTGAEQLLK